MENAYALPVDNVLKQLKTDEKLGLTDEDVEERREKYGPNGTVLKPFK